MQVLLPPTEADRGVHVSFCGGACVCLRWSVRAIVERPAAERNEWGGPPTACVSDGEPQSWIVAPVMGVTDVPLARTQVPECVWTRIADFCEEEIASWFKTDPETDKSTLDIGGHLVLNQRHFTCPFVVHLIGNDEIVDEKVGAGSGANLRTPCKLDRLGLACDIAEEIDESGSLKTECAPFPTVPAVARNVVAVVFTNFDAADGAPQTHGSDEATRVDMDSGTR